MKKYLLIPIIFALISCQKDLTIDPPINPPDPIQNAKKILILDSIVYTNTPASTCTGCPYISFEKISYIYNADDKVDRTIGVQNKTNGVFYFDTSIFEIEGGIAYLTRYASVIGSSEKPHFQGRINVGIVNALRVAVPGINVDKVYKNILPNIPGCVDTLESGLSAISYDAFGRVASSSYMYFQTQIYQQSFPLQRKIIAFPYNIKNQNDQNGLIRSENRMKVTDVDQQKASANVQWKFLSSIPYTYNNKNYYSTIYYYSESSVTRSKDSLLNANMLYFQELPEILLKSSYVAKNYVSQDSIKWDLINTTNEIYSDVKLEKGYVKSYNVMNGNMKLTGTVQYFFHEK